MPAPDSDQLVDAILVIVVAVAGAITRWRMRKNDKRNGPNGPLT